MKKLIAILIILATLLVCSCNAVGGEEHTTEAGCAVHTDSNEDGYCDECEVSVIVTVDLYGINDLHGKFNDTDADEGVDELTTYLRKMQMTDEHAILLSSGDMWQGGSESNLTRGNIITEWMNDLGFASMTLGNHEYDWGEEAILENAELAEFPILAINIYDKDTNQRVEYCAPSVVVECGEIEVGIIGAMGDCYSSIAPDKVEDVYFKTGRELSALVKAESERLREAGVEIIVYSLHDGYGSSKSGEGFIADHALAQYYDATLSEEGYVDIVFEGHTHQNYTMRDSYGVYHLQNGGDNRGISHAELSINYVTMELRVNEAEFVRSATYDKLEDDPIVGELLEKYRDEVAIGQVVLGQNARYRNSDFIRQLVAQLYLEKGIEVWGEQYDVVLGGGFLSVRSPYNLAAGEVRYSDLQSLLPFDNNLVLCSIQGKYLRQRFIETNNSDYFCAYDPSLPSQIEDYETYYIIVDSYSSSYGPNRLTEIARLNEDIFARDLVAEYIKQGGLE